jgi:hypothetical protein
MLRTGCHVEEAAKAAAEGGGRGLICGEECYSAGAGRFSAGADGLGSRRRFAAATDFVRLPRPLSLGVRGGNNGR